MSSDYFINGLISWYEREHRLLPWRESSDPYQIWLSEIMLQQTQVRQALPYYHAFTEAFPDIHSLAGAADDTVLRLWQGLGYYSRARNMHQCAKIVVKNYSGVFPDTYQELLKLPGIGKYTAAAIASIAFNEAVPVVDGNVYRVLSRLLGIFDDISSPQTFNTFFEISKKYISKNSPGIYNQALMELGALICSPRNPNCQQCPLASACYANLHQKQHELPVKTKKVVVKNRFLEYMVLEDAGRLALEKRTNGDIWEGLYDFPLIEQAETVSIEETIQDFLKKWPKLQPFIFQNVSKPYKHKLTHRVLHARFFYLKNSNENPPQTPDLPFNFYTIGEIQNMPKSKLVQDYLNDHIF